MGIDIDKFVHDQLSVWPEVASKYRTLKSGGAAAPKAPAVEPCSLCRENFMEQQHSFPFEGRKGRKYNVLVNREPSFPNHLVIARDVHVPQTIWHRFPDMLDLAQQLEGYLVLYDSPGGTTFPAHAHFEAFPRGYSPVERAADGILRSVRAGFFDAGVKEVASVLDAHLYHSTRLSPGTFILRARTAKSMAKQFYRLIDCLNLMAMESEPELKAFAWVSEGEYRAAVLLPAEEEERLLWRLQRSQPRIEVEIASGREISFEIISDGAGPQKVSWKDGKIDYNGSLYDEMVFEAVTISTLFAEPSFIIFADEPRGSIKSTGGEPRRYAGTLKFTADGAGLRAVNLVGAEDYLLSVVSLLPEDGRKEAAVALRSMVFRGEVPDAVYIGLTPRADSAAREAIDETWGKIL